MKEYHAVFEGFNKFQREETLQQDLMPPTYIMRDYEQLIPYGPISFFSTSMPPPHELKVKERCFRKRCEFYALGKNIVYYTEERN